MGTCRHRAEQAAASRVLLVCTQCCGLARHTEAAACGHQQVANASLGCYVEGAARVHAAPWRGETRWGAAVGTCRHRAEQATASRVLHGSGVTSGVVGVNACLVSLVDMSGTVVSWARLVGRRDLAPSWVGKGRLEAGGAEERPGGRRTGTMVARTVAVAVAAAGRGDRTRLITPSLRNRGPQVLE